MSADTDAMTTNDDRLVSVHRGDALLIVDVQNDFLPGGALAIPHGDHVVGVLNGYLELFASRKLPVFATRDWHPADHCSFLQQRGPWPAHCIAGSLGADFADELQLPENVTVISKATDPTADAYSGFDGTDLERRLREAGIQRLFIGGLATEFCVQATVENALRRGFAVILLIDAICAINVQSGGGDKAIRRMVEQGAVPRRSTEIR